MIPATGPGQELELFLSARHLKKMDLMSESDPFCRVYFKDSFMPQYSELGKTEVMNNQPNPNWAQTFRFQYLFEVEQTLMFEVLDRDEHRGELIGKCTARVGQIFTSKGTLLLDLRIDGSNTITGKLIIRAEQVVQCREQVRFEMRGTHIEDLDWFSKSDPFLVFHRVREDGTLLKVHQTEVIDNNLNPVWRPWTMSVQTLCNGDHFLPLVIECWDDESSGKHQFIGKTETNLEALRACPELPFVNPRKQSKKKYQNSGMLHVIRCEIWTEVDFLDYLKGGVELSLMVAIDFTGSNGQPSYPNSLHYINPAGPNSYEKAIWSVGGILEAYDNDRSFAVWGFGGKPRGAAAVSHCFSLAEGNVLGVPGIISAYRACLNGVELSGPTLFAHIINAAAGLARQSPPGTKYHVLLILTDGAIHDMPDTKRFIVDASGLPLSIIIVGIGNADFGNMEELDSDTTALRDSSGRAAVRDIVQFVPFNKYEGDGRKLAQEVLAEIPKQLVGFMKTHGVEPRPVAPPPMSEVAVLDPSMANMMRVLSYLNEMYEKTPAKLRVRKELDAILNRTRAKVGGQVGKGTVVVAANERNLKEKIEKMQGKPQERYEDQLREHRLKEALRVKQELEEKLYYVEDKIHVLKGETEEGRKAKMADKQTRQQLLEIEEKKRLETEEFAKKQMEQQRILELRREKLLADTALQRQQMEAQAKLEAENLHRAQAIEKEKRVEALRQKRFERAHYLVEAKARLKETKDVKCPGPIEPLNHSLPEIDLKKPPRQAISLEELEEHQRRYEERRKAEEDRRRQKLVHVSSAPHFPSSKVFLKMTQEERKLKEDAEKQAAFRAQIIEKQREYALLVRKTHLPAIDKKKAEESQSFVEPKARKHPRNASSDTEKQLNATVAEIPVAKLKPRRVRAKQASAELKQEKKVPDYLEEQRKIQVGFVGTALSQLQALRTESEGMEDLADEEKQAKMKNHAARLVEKVRRSEAVLSRLDPAEPAALQMEEGLNSLLINSIKTKMSLLSPAV